MLIIPPTIHAIALTNLGDLKIVIDSAAQTIGGKTNSSRNWGFGGGTPAGLGTADLVSNITTSILRVNANLGSNQTHWVEVTSDTDEPITLNLTATGVDDPYIDYVSTLPDLSAALGALGRSWHSELNSPVSTAIDALQQSVNTFSSSLLQAGLIHSNSTLRTIRSSNTLEDAQTAWSRMLNLPGPSSSKGPSKRSAERDAGNEHGLVRISFEDALDELRGNARRQARPPPLNGMYYTHEDLWGWDARRERVRREDGVWHRAALKERALTG